MHDQLRVLVDAVHKRDAGAQWLFVGDYINRGPNSKGVLDLLLQLPNARFCRGNHDDMFDAILNGEGFCEVLIRNSRLDPFRWFMEHGLADTLASYGVSDEQMQSLMAKPTVRALDAMIAPVPMTHRRFIRELPAVLEEPDLFIVHARWEPDTPDEDPSPTTFLEVDQPLRKTAVWGRYSMEEIDAPKAWRRTGYFGHTPVINYDPAKNLPMRGPQIVLTDTGAALGPRGRLTAVCADSGVVLQIDPNGIFAD